MLKTGSEFLFYRISRVNYEDREGISGKANQKSLFLCDRGTASQWKLPARLIFNLFFSMQQSFPRRIPDTRASQHPRSSHARSTNKSRWAYGRKKSVIICCGKRETGYFFQPAFLGSVSLYFLFPIRTRKKDHRLGCSLGWIFPWTAPRRGVEHETSIFNMHGWSPETVEDILHPLLNSNLILIPRTKYLLRIKKSNLSVET